VGCLVGRGSTGFAVVGGFHRGCPQGLRSPAIDSGSLGARFGEGRRGKWRGGYGLLIAAGMRRLKWGVKELMGERGVTGNGHRRRFRSELEDDWQVGPTCRREEREPGTGSG
jgi:hypothetical protein